jgi:hypothetical protein
VDKRDPVTTTSPNSSLAAVAGCTGVVSVDGTVVWACANVSQPTVQHDPTNALMTARRTSLTFICLIPHFIVAIYVAGWR